MAVRCQECGSASTGFVACPICGVELPERVPIQRVKPEASEQSGGFLQLLGSRTALAFGLVFFGVGVMILGFSLRPHNATEVVGRTATTDPAPAVSPTPTESSPSALASTASSTPTPTKKPAPPVVRRCWNGVRVSGSKDCAVPRGTSGLAAASSTFVLARKGGRCRAASNGPAGTGYNCSVQGVQMRFAWFPSSAALNARFKRTYPSCRTVDYIRVCTGKERQALRYTDPRFVLEFSVARSASRVLLKLPLNPASRMLHGSSLS